METSSRPHFRFLTEETIRDVVAEAKRILEEVGVRVELDEAVALLDGAGADVGDDGRVRVGAGIVEKALETVPTEVTLHDRDGRNPVRIGGDTVSFVPGSAAIKVWDHDEGRARPSTTEDCVSFARITDALPALAFQSTCVVPSDVPVDSADRCRLGLALENGLKPIVTGTCAGHSFDVMRQMLICVRGTEEALREKPLAIFDCCPTSPLAWSELTCATLVEAARAGVPAELVSVPMTGATSPVTLLGALTQHTAESLSGVVIHQLASPGSPLVYGACSSAFDMRQGTSPMGAIETMMINSAAAEVGRHLGLPTHAYMALSDSKTLDYQAGLESGVGAILAVLAGINVVSGPGMLEFASCQSLEKLVLDHEACAMALRAARGLERREETLALDVVREALLADHFLNVRHTREWFRRELHMPGPVIDRQIGDMWLVDGAKTSAERAGEEVRRLLEQGRPPLDPGIAKEIRALMDS